MPLELPVPFGANVQVVGWKTGGGAESLSPLDPQVSLRLVAGQRELPPRFGVISVRHDDVDVDDGLGGKPGHRCAPDVLNPEGGRLQEL